MLFFHLVSEMISRKLKGLFSFEYIFSIVDPNHKDLDVIKNLVEEGKLKACNNQIYTFKFEDTIKAFQVLATPFSQRGKIIVNLK